jgi:orotate phosphoribosyltransferase
MHDYQAEFIRYAIDCNVLRFGEFTLKSGRSSPYFFNTGLFDSGARMDRLGQFYAEALLHAGLHADVIFGPAYKGIPLACATAIALARMTGREIPFSFNRKEAKDHGEGGTLVGAALRGEVLIIDDVITAGTSVRESVDIIRAAGATPCGVLIALDRQEKGRGALSAVQDVAANFNTPVHSIITLDDIIEYLADAGSTRERETLCRYRTESGVP